jgi:UDP-4-amino-4,6-dideoxy-N-acetyl-beta-L-altrosamine transaminase
MQIIPYGKQCIDKSDIAEVIKVLKSDWITQGAKVAEFEKAISSYCGSKYAVVVSSGTAALHLACLAIGLGKGDEAITTPITFLATPTSILYTGARPVFADIDYETANISSIEISNKITSKTKAILPVHFAGFPCNMREIYKITKKNGLKIIEDACHALGAMYKHNGKWIKVGSCRHSDMTVFSFHPVKHITTGEGGAITTNNRKLYEKLRSLRTHGVYKDKKMSKEKGSWYYEMRSLGFNYRITDFQCALGISQLKKLDKFIKRRKKIAHIYNNIFKNNKYFDLPIEQDNVKSSWHLYAIKLKDEYKEGKVSILNKLKAKGISVQVHYIPVYLQPYYQKLGYKKVVCACAEDFYQRTVSIPLFPSMSNEDVKYTGEQVIKVFEGSMQ